MHSNKVYAIVTTMVTIVRSHIIQTYLLQLGLE